MKEERQLPEATILEHILIVAKFSIHPEIELKNVVFKQKCFGEIFFNIEGRARAHLYGKCICSVEFKFQLSNDDEKCGFDEPCPIRISMGNEFRLRSCKGQLEPCSSDHRSTMEETKKTFQA